MVSRQVEVICFRICLISLNFIKKGTTFTKEKVSMSKFRNPIQTVMSGGQIQSIFSLYCELKYARSSIVKMCLVRHNHYVSRGQRRRTHCIIFMTAELTGSDTELRGRGREYLNIYALDTTDVETFPYSSYIYLQRSCRKYLHGTETPLHCMVFF